MKKMFLKTATLSMLSVAALVNADCGSCSTSAAPYYNKRSQSVNAMLELVGWQNHINRCDMDSTWGSFYIAPEYEQTWGSCNLARCLFGPDLVNSTTTGSTVTTGCCDSGNCGSCDSCCGGCGSQIVVSGSAVEDRPATDWLADYFFLPRDFRSTISFCPEIQSVNIDLNLFIGLDELTEGLWFRIHAPITWTRWQLNFNETVTAAGTNLSTRAGGNYPEGYFSNSLINTTQMRGSASEFFMGQSIEVPSTALLGDVTMQPLKFSKWLTCGSNCQTETRLSDIEMALGYNFVCDEDAHFGLGIRASAPTGNRPTGQFLFEPIVGSGKHWKLGGMLTTHYTFWRSDDQENSWGFWLDANVQHWFNACQTRVFDLAGLPNSRYALAQKLAATDNVQGTTSPWPLTAPAAGYQWDLEFAPVANLTAANVKVNVDVEGDVVMKFAYTSGNGYQFDFGYEFWATSCENICLQSRCPNGLVNDTTWALKGDASVVGFGTDSSPDNTNQPVLLAATESLADIHGGTNFPDNNSALTAFRNVEIDSATLAFSGPLVNNIPTDSVFNAGGAALTAGQTNSSSTPIFITNADIGYADAQTKGLSNKVFVHFSRTWTDNEEWLPFLGIGASAEFGQNCGDCGNCDSCCGTNPAATVVSSSSSCCSDSCSSCCHECAVSQWAVWAKFGISFQ